MYQHGIMSDGCSGERYLPTNTYRKEGPSFKLGNRHGVLIVSRPQSEKSAIDLFPRLEEVFLLEHRPPVQADLVEIGILSTNVQLEAVFPFSIEAIPCPCQLRADDGHHEGIGGICSQKLKGGLISPSMSVRLTSVTFFFFTNR